MRLAVERAGLLTAVPATRRLARELLHALDAVPASRNVRSDFSAWRLERGHAHFEPLRSLCEMLLRDLNPLVGGQQATAHALLFDMNRVYEAYVARRLQSQYPDWLIETQVTKRALGQVGTRRAFNLRPDLLITPPLRRSHRGRHQMEAPERHGRTHLRHPERRRLPDAGLQRRLPGLADVEDTASPLPAPA